MENVFWTDDEGLQDWQKEILKREKKNNNVEHNGTVPTHSERETKKGVSK